MQVHARRCLFRGGALLGAVPLVLLAGLLWACTDQLPLRYPSTGVSLLVVNSTCGIGPCQPVVVLGFPLPGASVGPFNWALRLGTVTGGSACLTIPPSATFLLLHHLTDSSTDTTRLGWTPAQGLELEGYPGGVPQFTGPSGAWSFVPAHAPGWSVVLPGVQPAQPAPPCVTFPTLSPSGVPSL